MIQKEPKIDERSAEQIICSVKEKIGLIDSTDDSLGDALVQIFGRYCEIIIERLNKVPEKNYRAFLNELGVSRNPPTAARVPLTFSAVKSTKTATIVVPQYTKVTAPPGEGETSPIIFETTDALTLTNAELIKIVAYNSVVDGYTDHSVANSLDADNYKTLLFKGELPITHVFYIGMEEGFGAHLSSIHLFFSIEKSISNRMEPLLEWKLITEQGAQIVIPEKDSTQGLCRSGEIIFTNLPKWGSSELSGINLCWLSCQLLNHNSFNDSKRQNKFSIELPKITSIDLIGDAKVENALIDEAIFNNFPLDLSKDFFPFGAKPNFGDVFYLSCTNFAEPDVIISLNIKLTNAASSDTEPPIRRVNQSGDAVIRWEYWNDERWDTLECVDKTQAFTEDGIISFLLPDNFHKALVFGSDNANWIRARLISGHYGLEERFDYSSLEGQSQAVKFYASTLAPPAIQSISVAFHRKVGPVKPGVLLSQNSFGYEKIDVFEGILFSPFTVDQQPSNKLYFGFKAESQEILAEKKLDMFFQVAQSNDRFFYHGEHQFPEYTWQCWNGKAWKECVVIDETQSFTVSGLVSLFITADITTWDETYLYSEDSLFWIRAVCTEGEYQSSPVLQRILMNTVSATQTLTLQNEIIGSGNGTPDQNFNSSRSPILGDLILEVKEQQFPTEKELKNIHNEEGKNVVTTVKNQENGNQGFWVRWHEETDFLTSEQCDRHYVVERLSGEIRFGDGEKGMMPPIGANNIRLRAYKTGGGKSGNVPSKCVTQLHSSLPFVDSVINAESASGGHDIEDWGDLYARGSRFLRHRERAVTPEDYEDLAIKGSAQIARAKCYPLQDLASSLERKLIPGVVSLIIVPKSKQFDPRPNFELLQQTWAFINKAKDQDVSLVVLGPEYVRINIDVILMPAYDYSRSNIISDIQKCLLMYLHPLNGGVNSDGWGFGVKPHHSDIFALLESVPGMAYVRSLNISSDEERPGLEKSGVYLICAGELKIRVAQEKLSDIL